MVLISGSQNTRPSVSLAINGLTFLWRYCFFGLLACISANIPMLATSFSFTGSSQTFSVPVTGTYDIVAYGAAGGGAYSLSGGLGAEIGGYFNLTAGELLTVDVGGQGASTTYRTTAGGGGGSFVVAPGSVPLVVAGGGGGSGGYSAGGNALTGTAGGDGSPGHGPGHAVLAALGAGGSSGQGGSAGDEFGSGGGGGAGFYGNGGGNPSGGSDYPTLSGGGTGSGNGNGGFGGGGASGCCDATGQAGGGGGGGYSGGGGGGGGSYLNPSATKTILLAGIQSGNGLVTITQVNVPEPESYALIGLGLLGFGVFYRFRI